MTFADLEFPQGGALTTPIGVSTLVGWHAGEKLTVQDGEIRIFSQAVARAQAWVAGFVQAERSLADELIEERRSEALGESLRFK